MSGAAVAGRPAPGPPYRWAGAVSLLVLLGLLVSLAPSVTFWDAGEFIASMKILGIPHPPGTPLFVMMGHVFGMVFPVGEYAFRTNLQSALFAAAAAGCWFLVLQEAAGRYLGEADSQRPTRLRVAAATAGALIAAFGFTNWLNSNETEVYAVATFTTAAVTWLLLRWRASRGTNRDTRFLLLIAYLLGIAIGNHLLGLLVGPAALAFMLAELRRNPAADPGTARREWGDLAVLAGLWALLTGIGLGNATLIEIGGVLFLLALMFAARHGQLGFGLLMLGIALVGVTPYLYLYLRSAQHPMVNEAAPDSWNALIDVIRRAQYEVRTPLDDPTVRHNDPNNPGRSLTLIGLQLLNYLQYFDWQWAKSAAGTLVGGLTVRSTIMLGFVLLGWRGFLAQWRSDRSGAWMLLVLFLVTGLGLVAYMNFKPGFSVGYEQYPKVENHEVRERDYFFVLSFIVWGLWAGLGLLTLVRKARTALAGKPPGLRLLPYGVFAVALIPFSCNFPEADRQHGPDARLPGDFAYDLLNSLPPYGILFTYGDNDTFPLWWAQEVAGIRRDVTVVCLALAETDWYMRQMRDNPVRPFVEETAPAVWRGRNPVRPTWPLHNMTDAEIDAAVPQFLSDSVTLSIGSYKTVLPARTPLYGRDFLVLRIIQQNFGRRPIAWGLTATGTVYGLDRFLVQQGLAMTLAATPVDTTDTAYDLRRLMGAPLDIPITRRLLDETYRFGGLLEAPHRELETTSKGIASTLGLPFTQVALALQLRGDTAGMGRYIDRAALLTRNPGLKTILEGGLSRP